MPQNLDLPRNWLWRFVGLALWWICPWIWIYRGVDLGLGSTWDLLCGREPVERLQHRQRLFVWWRCDCSADRALLSGLAYIYFSFIFSIFPGNSSFLSFFSSCTLHSFIRSFCLFHSFTILRFVHSGIHSFFVSFLLSSYAFVCVLLFLFLVFFSFLLTYLFTYLLTFIYLFSIIFLSALIILFTLICFCFYLLCLTIMQEVHSFFMHMLTFSPL